MNPSFEKLSRDDIETLCLLDAVGGSGCPALELADRLGFAPELREAIAEAGQGLVALGWMALTQERFALSPAGADLLRLAREALSSGEPAIPPNALPRRAPL